MVKLTWAPGKLAACRNDTCEKPSFLAGRFRLPSWPAPTLRAEGRDK
jgi:hypothetical protein